MDAFNCLIFISQKLKADVCEIAWPEKLQQANLQVWLFESIL